MSTRKFLRDSIFKFHVGQRVIYTGETVWPNPTDSVQFYRGKVGTVFELTHTTWSNITPYVVSVEFDDGLRHYFNPSSLKPFTSVKVVMTRKGEAKLGTKRNASVRPSDEV